MNADGIMMGVFGRRAAKLGKDAKALAQAEKKLEDSELKQEHTAAPAIQGQDNTNRTPEQLEHQEEEPPQARIVAYSDSDEEDFNKHHRTVPAPSGDEGAAEASAEEEAVEGSSTVRVRRPAPGSVVRIGRNGAFAAAQSSLVPAAQAALAQLTPQNVVRLLTLTALQHQLPAAARALGLLTVVVPLPGLLAHWLGFAHRLPHLPHRLCQVAQQIRRFAVPAAVLQGVTLSNRLRKKRRRRRRQRAQQETLKQVDLFSDPDTMARAGSTLPLGSDGRTAAQTATLFPQELAEMKHLLKADLARLPVDRFNGTDSELMRFAHAAGLRKAKSVEDKTKAIEVAVSRVRATLTWLQQHQFLPPRDMIRYENVVRFQGRDSSGRPILVVRLTKACQECHGEQAEQVAEAVLSQIQCAVSALLSDDPSGAEQIVAVVDARDATTVQVARKQSIFKDVARTLSDHYPSRLHRLYLVDVPTLLKWLASGVLQILQPETRAKVRLCQLGRDFPFPESILQFRQLQGHVSLPADRSRNSEDSSNQAQRREARQERPRRLRRSTSVPLRSDSANDDQGEGSPRPFRRRRSRRTAVENTDVQGLGPGVRRRSRHSSGLADAGSIAEEPGVATPSMPLPDRPLAPGAATSTLQASTASAVAAVTLLFTFMAAVAQRFLAAYPAVNGP